MLHTKAMCLKSIQYISRCKKHTAVYNSLTDFTKSIVLAILKGIDKYSVSIWDFTSLKLWVNQPHQFFKQYSLIFM